MYGSPALNPVKTLVTTHKVNDIRKDVVSTIIKILSNNVQYERVNPFSATM